MLPVTPTAIVMRPPVMPPPVLRRVQIQAPPKINGFFVTGTTLTLLAGSHSLFSASTAQSKYVFFINGVERTTAGVAADRPEACQIQSQLGSIPTCGLTITSKDGSYRPQIDQELVVIDRTTGARLFGGDIDYIEETNPDATDVIYSRVRAVGYASRLDRRIVSAYYDGVTIIWTTSSMIADILNTHIPETGVVLANGGGSVIDTEVIFQHVSGTQALRQLLDKDGLDFTVDEYKRLYLVNKSTGYESAPFNVTDGANYDSDSMTVRRERGRYANRVGIRPDLREPGMWVDTFAGDDDFGVGFYLTTYTLFEKPVVTLNGVVQTVGEYWLPHLSNTFTYVPNGVGVYASNPGIYSSSEVIEVSYPSPLQPITWAEDAAEIAANGLVETVEEVKDVYSRDLLADIATGVLARLKVRPYVVDYSTRTNGLKPGQLQTINTTKPQVPNLSMVIDSVAGTYEPTADGGHFRWRVRTSNAQVQNEKNFIRTMQRVAAARIQPQDRHRTTIVIKLAQTVQGITNPGLTAITVPGDREIDKPGYIKEARLRFDTAPATTTVQVNVLINGTTIFPNGEYIEFRPADAGNTVSKRNFTSQPMAVADGDIVTCVVVTADSAAKDGTLELEIQG